jgi:WD40 repeat protein/cytochrome c-type biogenesis protein CcmH/NrfG
MSIQLENAIVRICTSDEVVVGVGFLVTEKLVLTCAHVVAQALGIPQDTPTIPTDKISLDFPLVAPGENFTTKVVKWFPVQSDESGDIACLELISKPPKKAQPARLIAEEQLWGHAFRAFGFPTGYDNGVWASGLLRAKQADGWVQVEDIKQTGYFIEPGFSGTAIWDEEASGVVGMAVVAERRAEVRAAFVIPISLILEILPELEQQTILPCPYRGLFHFREQDAEFFFGRGAYTEQLVEAVQHKPFVAVIGASGSGKSSVVYAGLFPRLRHIFPSWEGQGVGNSPFEGSKGGVSSHQWLITSFRPGDDPFRNLSKSLISFLYTDELKQIRKIKELSDDLRSHRTTLRDVIERVLERDGKAKKFLLFIDQFEELYTLCQEENERREFLDKLLPILPIPPSPYPPIFSLVLTMRADFLSKALSYRPFADTLQDASMMLGPMNREELRATIGCPAKILGVDIEEGLTDRILDAVSDEPGNLPLLEFALTKLWEKQSNRRLTHTAYDEIGGVEQALTSYANSEYKKLGPEEQEQAKRIFLQLVRPGEGTEDTRRIASRSDVGEDNWELVTRLASARLVVTGGSQMDATSESGAHLEETVEVIHESLIAGWPLLREWMEADREFRTWQERLRAALRQWVTSNKDEGALLRGATLAEAEQWLEQRRSDLSQEEQHFIEASVQLREEEQKSRKKLQQRVVLGLVTGLIIAAALSIFAVIQWRRAEQQTDLANKAYLESEEQRKITFSNLLAAQATSLLDERYDQALLLSVEANHVYDTFEARSSLFKALQHNPHLIGMMRFGEAKLLTGSKSIREKGLEFSADGRTLVSLSSMSDRQHVLVWNMTDHSLMKKLLTCHDVDTFALHPDGKILMTSGGIMWDITTGQQITSLPGAKGGMAFSPDGSILVSGSHDGVILWDVATHRPIGQPLDISSSCISFSPDGKLLASVTWKEKKETITLWDIEKHQLLAQLPQEHESYISSLAFHPDGTILASGDEDGNIILWDIATHQLLAQLSREVPNEQQGSEYAATLGWRLKNTGLAFSPNGKILASTFERDILLWDVATYKPLGEPLRAHSYQVEDIAFSPDGEILASLGWDNTILLWNIDEPRSLRSVFAPEAEEGRLATFSPDNKLIAFSSEDNVSIWNITTKQPVYNYHLEQIQDMAFSPDGKHLAVGSADIPLIVIDLVTFQHHQEDLPDTLQDIRVLTYRPNSNLLALGNKNGTILLWDPGSSHVVTNLSIGHSSELSDLAFSPDGTILVAADTSGTITLWDITHPNSRGESFPVFGENVSWSGLSLSFHPEGHSLLITTLESYMLWNVETRQSVKEFSTGSSAGFPIFGAFSPDGNFFVWARIAETGIHLMDASGRQMLGYSLQGAGRFVIELAFSADSKTLGAYAQDLGITTWDFDISSWQARACNIVNRNLTHEEWQQFMGDEPYRKTCSDLPVPGEEEVWYNKGIILHAQNKLDEAVAAFENQVRMDPDHKGAWYRKGNSLQKQGNLEETIRAFQKHIEVSPDHADAWSMLGDLLTTQEHIEEAIAAYRKLVEIQPEYKDAWYKLGKAYYDQGSWDEAIEAFKKQLAIKPFHLKALRGVNEALQKKEKQGK